MQYHVRDRKTAPIVCLS